MNAGNPLVAGAVDTTTPFSGTFLLEDGEMLCTAIQNGDWVSGGLATFSAAMDGLSFAIDPLGSLIAMGLGWVIDHIEPIKGWFNDLTGDAGEVMGFATTWQNIAGYLAQAAGDLQSSLAGLSEFRGQAGTAFAAFHADTAKHLDAAGQWSSAIGTGMQIASTIVQMVHDMTRDAITTIIGTAASAATTTVLTLGFGAPVAVAQVTSKVASLAGKLAKFVTRLLASIRDLTKLVDKLVALFKKLSDVVAGALRSGPAPKTPDAPAAPTPPVSRADQIKANQAQGAKYADEQAALDSQRLDGFQQEITIRVTDPVTGESVKFRIDGIGRDPDTGKLVLLEYKSSPSAPLTGNQAQGFPIFQNYGGEVVGAGKGDFSGGTVLEPIKQVTIRRP
jgi:hypothetical protein